MIGRDLSSVLYSCSSSASYAVSGIASLFATLATRLCSCSCSASSSFLTLSSSPLDERFRFGAAVKERIGVAKRREGETGEFSRTCRTLISQAHFERGLGIGLLVDRGKVGACFGAIFVVVCVGECQRMMGGLLIGSDELYGNVGFEGILCEKYVIFLLQKPMTVPMICLVHYS